MQIPRARSLWDSILRPQTTFWRFFLAATVIGGATATLALLVAMWIGRGMLNELQERSGYTVLRNTVDMIGRTSISIEELRTNYIEDHKEVLRNSCVFATALLDTYHADAEAGRRSTEDARATAFARLNQVVTEDLVPVFVIDSDFALAVHPDDQFRSRVIRDFQDAEGDFVFRDLVDAARRAPEGTVVFSIYSWFRPGRPEQEPKLTAALYYAPWGVTVCSDIFLGDIDKTLAEKQGMALNELRARMREVSIGKTGYIYLFDDDCRMVAHPTLTDEDFGAYKVPGTDRPLCREIKRAAEQAWGDNKYYYDWDRPDDRGHYAHPKVAWATREPTTGWYVVTTAYLDEIHAGLPRFFLGIFLPSLGSILILGGALALLLRNLLRPIGELAEVCRHVSRGDLSMAAREDSPGEVGVLCRHFNIMIRRLRGLRQKELRRRQELEDLNLNLEKIVAIRTRALERKAMKLEEANVRLQELDTMKSAFLSSVSHELRTPLTSIRGFAKLIAKEFRRHFAGSSASPSPLGDKARRIEENVNIIAQEGERLTRLINDVLDLAKIESGRFKWSDGRFALADVVERSVSALSSVLAARPGVEVVADIPDDLPLVLADRDRMTQVFINLLDNACKFTVSGSITVTACTGGGWLQVRVADTGMGMRRPDLVKVFDKFHQAVSTDTLQEKPKGTGLGLAICHNIISHYGGVIWAEAEPGRGSVFAFEMPLDHLAAPRDDDPDDPAYGLLDAHGQQEGPTPGLAGPVGPADAPLILVVDDEPALRSYLEQVFENEGYRTLTAANGAQALELARLHAPDLITMDILMPRMNGEEAVARLRADDVLRDTPIVVISVLRERDAVGGDAALGKPVDEEKLLETVAGLLFPSPERTSPCLVLTAEGDGDDPTVLTHCPSDVRYCRPEDLWNELEAGFTGMVLVPAPFYHSLDKQALSSARGIQVVVIPGAGREGGAQSHYWPGPPPATNRSAHDGEATPADPDETDGQEARALPEEKTKEKP